VFVSTPVMLVLTAASALFPVKILAPGYVAVYSRGLPGPGWVRSVYWGPLSNLLVASTALYVLLVAWALGHTRVAHYMSDVAYINGYLALFNMLPFPPLDGAKVLVAGRGLWLRITGAAAALTVLSWAAGILLLK